MTKNFPESDFLKNSDYAKERLNSALEDAVDSRKTDDLMNILRQLIRYDGGISKLSLHTGINRQRIYRCLEPGGNPKVKSLLAILDYLGFHLEIKRKKD
jgi:probable addiction module antidote protein